MTVVQLHDSRSLLSRIKVHEKLKLMYERDLASISIICSGEAGDIAVESLQRGRKDFIF